MGLSLIVLVAGLTMPVSGQAPAGKLVLFSDMALFAGVGKPENCTLRNRFKRGEPAGFRISAVDGLTGEPEKTAQVVVHVTFGGRTVDVPARYRGVPGGGPVVPNLWSAKWMVPADAPVGTVRYTVTAKDSKGRTATFTPFPDEASQLTIVQ